MFRPAVNTFQTCSPRELCNADGSAGPNFKQAQQFQAVAPFQKQFFISLNESEKTPYKTLPIGATLNDSPLVPLVAGVPVAALPLIEPSLETADLGLLLTGTVGPPATGATQTTFLTPTFSLPLSDSGLRAFLISPTLSRQRAVAADGPAGCRRRRQHSPLRFLHR